MLIIAALFIYIIAVIFRLLDNSAALLIKHGISVNPFYLKPEVIRDQIDTIEDTTLVAKLHRNLLFQKLHTIFSIATIATFVIGIIYEIYNPYLVHLL